MVICSGAMRSICGGTTVKDNSLFTDEYISNLIILVRDCRRPEVLIDRGAPWLHLLFWTYVLVSQLEIIDSKLTEHILVRSYIRSIAFFELGFFWVRGIAVKRWARRRWCWKASVVVCRGRDRCCSHSLTACHCKRNQDDLIAEGPQYYTVRLRPE